jgi:hypothetical protein
VTLLIYFFGEDQAGGKLLVAPEVYPELAEWGPPALLILRGVAKNRPRCNSIGPVSSRMGPLLLMWAHLYFSTLPCPRNPYKIDV